MQRQSEGEGQGRYDHLLLTDRKQPGTIRVDELPNLRANAGIGKSKNPALHAPYHTYDF